MSDYSKTLYTSGYAETEIELVDCKRDSIDAKEPLFQKGVSQIEKPTNEFIE